ncbi:MAG: Rrf2 family transcriptional regulator [Patescibacteria group bacterium]|nr:Rrf2 family transcriptional regulator [Patescibacteria group bacterium]
MHVSQKCQYTLRALFELAKRRGDGPVNAGEIARAQAIPPRFLELILQGLKNSGEVDSRRGIGGGYVLAVSPGAVSVGDVIRSVDGSSSPVRCGDEKGPRHCDLKGRCAFGELWGRARQAIEQVYDTTTLQDLIDHERAPITCQLPQSPEYVI